MKIINNKDQGTIQWYPGHMAKAKRNIEKDLALVDLVIEVVDARVPQSSRNPELSRLIAKKPLLIVLNKKDLADPKETTKWLNYYRQQGCGAVSLNGAQKQGVKDLLTAIKVQMEPLMLKLESKGRNRRSIRAMIIGIPNTGKSTLINALTPKGVTKTGNKPGVTKGQQWVKTAEGLELLDTPGVLWPKFISYDTAFKLAVIGSISDLVYPVEEVCRYLFTWLLQEHPDAVQTRYKLTAIPADVDDLIEAIGRQRGMLGVGGVVLRDNVLLMLLQEFRSGKIGHYTLDDVR